jgi:heterodisulfide reductase subunit B
MPAPGSAGSPARYLYFPGCSLKSTGAAYEESLLTMFRLLGIGVDELEDWNCCGATSYMAISEGSAFALAARNLALAERAGARELMAPCSACYLVLMKTMDYRKKYASVNTSVREALERAGLPVSNKVHVRHPLEILHSDIGVAQIKSNVVRGWTGGRLACYYGCQAVRPYSEVDDPHQPTKMEQLLNAIGVPTVDYTLRTKCCGGSLTGTIPTVGLRLNYELLKESIRSGAEAIVTICPLCQFNLDAYQAQIRSDIWRTLDVPVLYLTQVIGWMLGGEWKELGLNRSISGVSVLKRWFSVPKEKEAYV